jgi:oxygen-dependent protoporphyrinogen oxidase
MSRADVLIVGGGISGLSLAWWLSRAGLRVDIWEAADRPGGKICSTSQDGYLTEQAAAMLMNFKPEVAQLIQQAGLEDAKTARMPIAENHRYLLQQGQLHALPMKAGAMLCSPLWSWRGKLRLLAEAFIPAGKSNEETVSQFISRRLGREMLDKAMEPFVAGTLAADPYLASAAATLPRLTALEQRYGSITAGVLLHRLMRKRTACLTDTFSFQGGMSTLVDTLARTPGVNLKTGYQVNELVADKTGWRVSAQSAKGEHSRYYPQVVLATPAPVAAKLLASLSPDLQELLTGIRYAPVSVVHLGFDRQAVGHALDGTGFLAPKGEMGGRTSVLSGNLWMSSLFPDRAPVGKVLLTAYLGGARAPQVINWNEARTVDETLDSLQPILNLKADPEMVRVTQHHQALPLYHGDYPARLQSMAEHLAQLPGLYLEANYQGGVSVRDRLARGQLVAERILARHHQLTRSEAALPGLLTPVLTTGIL